MLAAMRNSDDEHVRSLLDQRTQRADVPPPHARFSAFSECSESPSLYSNHIRNTPITPASRFPHINELDAYDNRPSFPTSSQDRLADPNASSLELSDDNHSESGARYTDVDDNEAQRDHDDGEPETRMSLLGPKMRVHSRAPWETAEDGASDTEPDDGGMDGRSIFGGRKSGRSMIRGLGFGSAKSAGPRPSFESKGKRSFDTISSSMGSNSQSALHALAQASVSTTSLALGPSPSAHKPPHKLSMPRLALNRSRTTSTSSDRSPLPPPLPSPRSAVASERSYCRSPPIMEAQHCASPTRSEFSNSRVRSPSPITVESSGAFVHPYANPALLSFSNRESLLDPFSANHANENSRNHIARSDSLATLAASEETVVLSHSASTNTTVISAQSGLEYSTAPTSNSSLASAHNRPPKSNLEPIAESDRQTRRPSRDIKLGPISAPSVLTKSELSVSVPYTLISLEEAQALAKERSRNGIRIPRASAAVPFPVASPTWEEGAVASNAGAASRTRARTTSASAKTRYQHPCREDDYSYDPAGDVKDSTAATTTKFPSPVGPPAGKTLKAKRSGFMKLFNGREKDKLSIITRTPHSQSDRYDLPSPAHTPVSPMVPKVMTHRVPVPPLSPNFGAASGEMQRDTVREANLMHPTKKTVPPSLSVKVSSPPTTHSCPFDTHGSRRSDSHKLVHPLPNGLLSPSPPASAPPGTTQFASLSLRPVSALFSENFSDHLLRTDGQHEGSALMSPTYVGTDSSSPSPTSTGSGSVQAPRLARPFVERSMSDGGQGTDGGQASVIVALQEQIKESRKAWQRQIWELEGQVRDLKGELDELRSGDVCEVCGRGDVKHLRKDVNVGVVHRPRAKTGTGARFASGNTCDRS